MRLEDAVGTTDLTIASGALKNFPAILAMVSTPRSSILHIVCCLLMEWAFLVGFNVILIHVSITINRP